MNHADHSVNPSAAELPSKVSRNESGQKFSLFHSVIVPILSPFASLKLTVGLLILSVFVIWVATLQQVESDIWDVKRMHFPYLFVHIPLYTFCPPAWLPGARQWLTDQGWGIFMPSGFSVILAMLLNLFAAHTVRFKLKAKGKQALAGWLTLIPGILICTGVVLVGQSDGLQAKPPIEYDFMWTVVLVAMFACGLVAGFFGYRFEKHRVLERILSFALGFLLCGLPILLGLTGASIGDSGMRILWQIAQCSVASLVLYGGLALLFHRKAGIVLLHAGLILLLGNEIWVTLNHQEQRLGGIEGQTVSHSIDIRATELVLVERTGDQDLIYAVPSEKLIESTRFATDAEQSNGSGQWIEIPETNLEVRCLDFFQNSEPTMASDDNPANTGLGARVMARKVDPVSGVEMNEMNSASAYVQFRTRDDGKELGTYLATQFQRSGAPIFAIPNIVEEGDHRYAVALWYKRSYKPYDVTINSIESMDYPGTEIPRWYSTEFKIVDHETGYEGVQKVWMNNPLRYRNETFYQSGYFRDPETGQESTTLQVVKNRGWMIPYLCCAMVSIGLLAQFFPVMLGYMEKLQRQSLKEAQQQVKLGEQSPGFVAQWWVPALAASILGLTFIGWAYPKKPKVDGLNLQSLAMIPVSYKGRVQPLDSVARTALRATVGREEAATPEKTSLGSDKKYPAIVWLADSLFSEKPAHEYRIYRIYNRQLLDNMTLPHRSGFQYTSKEVDKSISVLQKLNDKAFKKDKDQRDALDKSVLDLGRNIAMVRMTMAALGQPKPGLTQDGIQPLYLQVLSAASTKTTTDIPGVVPGVEPMAPWLPIDVAETRLKLEAIAQGAKDPKVIAVHLINYTLAEKFVNDPDSMEQVKGLLTGDQSQEEKTLLLSKYYATLPPETIKQTFRQYFGFDEALFQQFVKAMVDATQELLGEGDMEKLNETQVAAVEAWRDFKAAYAAHDQEKLDTAAAKYQEVLASSDKISPGLAKVKTEYTLSGWAPFYVGSVICLFVSVISFPSLLGMPRLRRTSFLLLMLALGLITIGLILRIYISGRAPVTSLYSSALGIAWGCVVGFAILEAITRRGIGNLLAGFSGFAILLTAYNLSLNDDKFTVLRAVLDTQFWLWTHVTCVALGYVLTLVAGLWSCVMFFAAVSSERKDVKLAADLTYGIICAATVLSFVGTVLGGLWADDSWGRFWGWDPKENGAAMIVLWNAAVLHARWSGLIRYRGLMVMAIIGNMITLWSWFAVNELGIGLHAYGFTEGVIFALTLVWIFHLLLIALAFLPVKNMDAKVAT